MDSGKRELINKILIAVFTSVIIAIIFAYRFNIYFFILKFLVVKTSKPENNEKIKSLHPVFAYKISRFIKELEKNGSNVTVTSAMRTPEEQQILVSTGQTDTSPLNSYHNYGLAVDLNVDGAKKSSPKSEWKNTVAIADKFGLRWGGNFADYDPVHFDYGLKYSITELKNRIEEKKVVNSKFVKII